MASSSKATAYLKRTCPFCLKFRIFINESGIEERFQIVVFDDGDTTHQRMRQRFDDAGQKAAFPAVELESGQLDTGTDELIARYAKEANVDPAALPLLAYYEGGVFKKMPELFMENQRLKGEG